MHFLQSRRGAASDLATAIGCSQPFIWQMAGGRRSVPVERAADIERSTGGVVMRWDLRPTDWHRIWPELVAHPLAPAVPGSSAAGVATEAPALVGSAS